MDADAAPRRRRGDNPPESGMNRPGTGEDAPTGPVDYRWVMQVTFVVTIAVGAPLVAVLSLGLALPTWEDKAGFAVRAGAVVWLVTALGAYTYDRRRR